MRVLKKTVCLLASAVVLLSGCIYYPKDAIVLKEQGSMIFPDRIFRDLDS